MRLFNIIFILTNTYIYAFRTGAPAKTCSYNLPIGSGKSHHGTYPVSDPRLTLTLFNSSNKIVTEYQSNSVYTLQISSTEAYTGYLFGAFDSVLETPSGSLSYFTDDTISKHNSPLGCITHSNQVSLQTTKVLWTSPLSTDSVVHLQSVVTFYKQSSLITLSVQGAIVNVQPTTTNTKNVFTTEPITQPPIIVENLNNSTDNTSHDSFLLSTDNIIIIIVLSVFAICIAIIAAYSLKKIATFKSRFGKTPTNDKLNLPANNNPPVVNSII